MESDKEKGLFEKYLIEDGKCSKLANPTKVIDAVILEFDDPLARVGIAAFADAVEAAGYTKLAGDLHLKMALYSSEGLEDDEED